MKYDFDSLRISWEDFFKVHGYYPRSTDYCNKEFNIPSHHTIMRILADRKEEFFTYYKKREIELFRENYNRKCEEFKRYCLEYGVPPFGKMTKCGFPSAMWFVRHSLDENIKTFPDFVSSLGFKPNYNISKEIASKLIHMKANKLNRTPMYEDFCGLNNNQDLGINVIKRIWGTFNNMLVDLGFEINQENMMIRAKSIEEMQDDILKVCEFIRSTEERINISHDDFDEIDWCLSPQTYAKHLKEQCGISLSDYIKSIGFVPNNIGVGMRYEFDDGEITTSKFEYDTSVYLKSNSYTYHRNIRYSSFVFNYEGKKDCDYVIYTNDKVWYVEIAGMVDSENDNTDDKIKERYRDGISEKESMLKSIDANYRFIYPNELRTKPLNEVFSFLS